MRSRRAFGIGSGLLVAALLALAGSVWRIDVRHSAPYGFSKTIDFDRSIAVSGGSITPNYDDFNRLDLDLRAYYLGTIHDLTIHIRPAQPGEVDVRTLHLDVPSERVFHLKDTFENPFLTVRFPAIPDSAGKTYYVWVESGPRNRDDVIALWSIKSYSRVPAWKVVSAFLNETPGGTAPGLVRLALILLTASLVLSASWFVWRFVATSIQPEREVNFELKRWHQHEPDGIQ